MLVLAAAAGGGSGGQIVQGLDGTIALHRDRPAPQPTAPYVLGRVHVVGVDDGLQTDQGPAPQLGDVDVPPLPSRAPTALFLLLYRLRMPCGLAPTSRPPHASCRLGCAVSTGWGAKPQGSSDAEALGGGGGRLLHRLHHSGRGLLAPLGQAPACGPLQ